MTYPANQTGKIGSGLCGNQVTTIKGPTAIQDSSRMLEEILTTLGHTVSEFVERIQPIVRQEPVDQCREEPDPTAACQHAEFLE